MEIFLEETIWFARNGNDSTKTLTEREPRAEWGGELDIPTKTGAMLPAGQHSACLLSAAVLRSACCAKRKVAFCGDNQTEVGRILGTIRNRYGIQLVWIRFTVSFYLKS